MKARMIDQGESLAWLCVSAGRGFELHPATGEHPVAVFFQGAQVRADPFIDPVGELQVNAVLLDDFLRWHRVRVLLKVSYTTGGARWGVMGSVARARPWSGGSKLDEAR